MSILTTTRAVLCLLSGPKTVRQVAEAAGMATDSTHSVVKELRDAGLIEFHGYVPRQPGQAGAPMGLYSIKT